MSRSPVHRFDVTDLQAEMRRILPGPGPRQSDQLKQLRLDNIAARDRALLNRQRPSRVS